MKTEMEKMRSGELTDFSDAAIQESFRHAKLLLAKLQTKTIYDDDYRALIEDLIPGIPKSATVVPPFHCDHGHGIILGEKVFVNAGCTFLDGGYIRIGAHSLIGPHVQIYTPEHPMDYVMRREEQEYSHPVTIGEDCWICGGAIICPGVTIGDRSIIGAGSVVTKDVPPDSLAVGNPCRVIKHLDVKR